jgi:DNA-binding SARP family transcriptional activator/TolB-like protein
LALLAVLATAGDRGVSRDRLLALFSPEADEDAARSALKQAVYALRRDLASDEVITGINDLRLNPAVIAVDVWDFERAIADGRLADAAALYAGPFLDGIHIGESAEFDPWADAGRERLERQFLKVLEQLAQQAERDGDPSRVVAAWRRLAERRPLDSRIALATARALAAAGDRGGALTQLLGHEARIREELGIDADAAIAGAIVELRAARTSGPIERMPESVLDGSMPPGTAPAAPGAPRRRAGRWAVGAALVLTVAVAVSGSLRARAAASRASNPRLAVLPFHYHGDTAFAYLGAGIVSVLSSTLDGVGAVHAADPQAVLALVGTSGETDPDQAANRVGVAWTIAGDIVEAGGRLRLSATLRQHVAGKRSLTASAEGSPRDFLQLVDQLAAELAAGLGQLGDAHLTRAAAATTSSYAALRAYLLGEGAMRAGRYGDAVSAFGEAVTTDSLFAIAWYRLSIAADWAASDTLEGAALKHTRQLASRLPPREANIVRAHGLWVGGDADGAETAVRQTLADYPDDVSAWYLLGEVLFHSGSARGRLFNEARLPFERVLALDSLNAETMIHLARIAASEGRRDDAMGLMDRAIALRPPDERLELVGFRAFVAGDSAAERAVLDDLRLAGPRRAYNVAWRVAVYTHDWEATDRLLQVMTGPTGTRYTRTWGYVLRADLAIARGRWRQGLAFFDSAATGDSATAVTLRGFYLGQPFAPELASERRATLARLTGWNSARMHPVLPYVTTSTELMLQRMFLLGLLAARDGDVATASRNAGAISSAAVPEPLMRLRAQSAAVLRAQLELVAGRPGPAGDWLGRTIAQVGANADVFPIGVLARFTHATLLTVTGHRADAVPWFQAIDGNDLESVTFIGPALQATAAIQRERGDRSGELASLRELVALWKDCDAELRPQLEAARRRLVELAGR